MAACAEILSGGHPCIGTATHGRYCAVHKRCPRCNEHHVDRQEYRCTSCGTTMCVAQTTLTTDPRDRKKFTRHHDRAYRQCGPVEPTGARL